MIQEAIQLHEVMLSPRTRQGDAHLDWRVRKPGVRRDHNISVHGHICRIHVKRLGQSIIPLLKVADDNGKRRRVK